MTVRSVDSQGRMYWNPDFADQAVRITPLGDDTFKIVPVRVSRKKHEMLQWQERDEAYHAALTKLANLDPSKWNRFFRNEARKAEGP